MLELMKKAMLTGIGLASLSKEKIEEIAGELIEQGKATEIEGRKFVEEMSGYAEKSKELLEKQAEIYVEKAMKKMDLARKSDLDELKEIIERLQSQLEKRDIEVE